MNCLGGNFSTRRHQRPLAWITCIVLIATAVDARADIVTVWENQFTSTSGWSVPSGTTFVIQASPNGVIGGTDGFEARFINTSGSAKYATFTIPASLVQAGDMVQYAVRSDFADKFAADRVNLVSPSGGNAFDSGFVAHDSTGGLTFRTEPGSAFNVSATTLVQGLRSTTNLFLGNSGYGGAGVQSIFYIDYIRIVGERVVPGDHTWNQSVSGSWNSAANWGNGVPNANVHRAIFNSTTSSAATITVDSPVTVKSLQLNSNKGLAFAGLGGITLTADSGSASIDVLQAASVGTHQFQTPVQLGSNTTINVTAGAQLDFNNSLNLNSKTLTLNSGVTNINNVVATGSGSVINAAILGGSGSIAGSLTNTASGTLRAEILGTGPYDVSRLSVSGTANLAGILDLSLGSFNPMNGQQFTVFTGGSLINSGLTLDPSDAGRFILSFSGGSVVVRAFGSADYNGDGTVNASDYVVWRKSLGSSTNLVADGNGNGIVDNGDFDFWRQRLGSNSGAGTGAAISVVVPEPTTGCLGLVCTFGLTWFLSIRRSQFRIVL